MSGYPPCMHMAHLGNHGLGEDREIVIYRTPCTPSSRSRKQTKWTTDQNKRRIPPRIDETTKIQHSSSAEMNFVTVYPIIN